jgi:hypothetical protein
LTQKLAKSEQLRASAVAKMNESKEKINAWKLGLENLKTVLMGQQSKENDGNKQNCTKMATEKVTGVLGTTIFSRRPACTSGSSVNEFDPVTACIAEKSSFEQSPTCSDSPLPLGRRKLLQRNAKDLALARELAKLGV